MKRALDVILLVLASVVFGSCNKSVFSNGELVERNDTLREPFRIVEFNNNVNVNLMHCDENHFPGLIHIKTGENLIDNIAAEIQYDSITGFNKLVISNNGTHDYLRPYDYLLEMTVYYDSIYALVFNSNGIVITDSISGIAFHDTITVMQDSIPIDSIVKKYKVQINVLDGSGELHLKVNGPLLYTDYQRGTSNIYAEGYSSYALTKTNYECHGLIDYRKMESRNHDIYHYGTNRIYTKVFSKLNANNYNNGEIHYVKFKKMTYDYCLPDDEHPEPWGYHDWKWHHCPENLIYNGRTFHGWSYDNDEAGLVKDDPS